MKKIFLILTFTALFTLSSGLSPINAQIVTPANKLLVQTQNEQTRLSSIKAKADTYIEARINAVNSMISYINTSKLVSTDQAKETLLTLNSDLSGLTTLKGQIDSFSSTVNIKSELLPLVDQIFTTYRVYSIELPKDHLLFHSVYFDNLNNTFNTAKSNMTQDVAYAQSQGKDITTIQSDLAAYNTSLIKYNSDVTTAENDLKSISPADYQKGANVFTNSKADFAAAHQDIQAIHSSFKQFSADFKKLF